MRDSIALYSREKTCPGQDCLQNKQGKCIHLIDFCKLRL